MRPRGVNIVDRGEVCRRPLKGQNPNGSGTTPTAPSPHRLDRGSPRAETNSPPKFAPPDVAESQLKTHCIEPGSPWQNACGESFNGKFGDECLNMEVFQSLAETNTFGETWRQSYNQTRAQSCLGYQTPAEFAAGWKLKFRPDAEWDLHARRP